MRLKFNGLKEGTVWLHGGTGIRLLAVRGISPASTLGSVAPTEC